jgi:hypothetical protein
MLQIVLRRLHVEHDPEVIQVQHLTKEHHCRLPTIPRVKQERLDYIERVRRHAK